MKIQDIAASELAARGFRRDPAGWRSPNDTIVIDEALLDEAHVLDFLDTMVSRREKIFYRTFEPSEQQDGKNSYDDAVAAIQALKAALRQKLG